MRTAPIRLCALGHLSFAHVPSIRYIDTASAGDEGSIKPNSLIAAHHPGAARLRSHTLEAPSFVCVLTTKPLAGTASAVRWADALRLGIS